jgi:lysophospholipid acyltransferase (LPLAT)-like uncharacterized protein
MLQKIQAGHFILMRKMNQETMMCFPYLTITQLVELQKWDCFVFPNPISKLH